MNREDIIRMAREAGWSGLYTTYNEPTGKADWQMVKESLTVPVTMEQIERFAALVAAAEAEKYKWDIHSCGPTCTKVACVAMREAVEAEREACAKFCDEQQELVGAEMCCVAMNCADAIRARGKREAD